MSPFSLIKCIIFTNLMERLSISLDDESVNIINKYLPKYKGSKANLIRKALISLKNFENLIEKTDYETIKTYIDFLANMEHVIVDISHWQAIFSEIDEGSEKFWDEVYNIGLNHMKEFADKGLKNIQQILEYIEKTNLYKLSVNSENRYTLVLAVSEASKFTKLFLEGIFKNYHRDVEIIEENKKIRIRVL